MAAMGARQDNPGLQAPDLWTPCDGQRSGVLIMGARRGDEMGAMGARQDNPGLQAPDLWTPCDGQRSGVLIMGARRGDVFVATEVLISADTLGDEAAIRAWLAQHDTSRPRAAALPPRRRAPRRGSAHDGAGR
jgi:hypothetical protein